MGLWAIWVESLLKILWHPAHCEEVPRPPVEPDAIFWIQSWEEAVQSCRQTNMLILETIALLMNHELLETEKQFGSNSWFNCYIAMGISNETKDVYYNIFKCWRLIDEQKQTFRLNNPKCKLKSND